MRWTSCGRRDPGACGSPGWASMPAMERSRRSCGHWMMRERCLSPTSTRRNLYGRRRQVCMFRRQNPVEDARRRSRRRRRNRSRWKTWSRGSATRTGRAACCATARAGRCRLILGSSPRTSLARRRVWVWDGEEAAARCWHLVVRREVGSPKTIKYSLCNAPAETPLLQLGQVQGQRYWVERTFEDAKGQWGLADYQAVGWRAWHNHVSMVMLAMLFIAGNAPRIRRAWSCCRHATLSRC